MSRVTNTIMKLSFLKCRREGKLSAPYPALPHFYHILSCGGPRRCPAVSLSPDLLPIMANFLTLILGSERLHELPLLLMIADRMGWNQNDLKWFLLLGSILDKIAAAAGRWQLNQNTSQVFMSRCKSAHVLTTDWQNYLTVYYNSHQLFNKVWGNLNCGS